MWSEQGEKALTMRAVARAAKTTTPTVYQRFRDKTDLKHFLEERDELTFQLFALVHGTALLRPTDKEHEKIAEALTEACLKAYSVLLRGAARRKKNHTAKTAG